MLGNRMYSHSGGLELATDARDGGCQSFSQKDRVFHLVGCMGLLVTNFGSSRGTEAVSLGDHRVLTGPLEPLGEKSRHTKRDKSKTHSSLSLNLDPGEVGP